MRWARDPRSIGKKILVCCVRGEHITHYCKTSRYMQNWTCRRPHDALRSPSSFITQHLVPICYEGISFSDALIFKSDLLSSFTMKSYFCPRFQVGLFIIPLYKFPLPIPPLITRSSSGIFLKTTPKSCPSYKSKQLPSTAAHTDYNRAATCQVTSDCFLFCHHDSSLPYSVISTRSLPYSVISTQSLPYSLSTTLSRLSM